ncbi:MAG: SH3 domain-containing protein, partial [Saprospirales bacterium]|nr:SH3 domain-containing protein [Saprospirales bacterium]
MKFLPWLALAGSLFAWNCTDQATYTRAIELLEESRQQFCPDKRVCIWEVDLSQKKPFVLKGSTNIPEAKELLLQKLTDAKIPFMDSLQVLPSVNLEGKHFGLVCVSVCNIRSEPKHASELATQATLGSPLMIYEQRGDWFRVQTPDKYIGWLDNGGFTRCDSATWENWRRAEKLL